MTPAQQQITELWGQITAATHRFLELLADFDDDEGWSGAGIMSCAHWLNVFCGIGMVAAREKVRVAHALRNLPAINAAFAEGRVSYSKVRAMTRVATPENEHILLNIAIHGTAAHVERTVRHYRRVERIEDAELIRKAIERAMALAETDGGDSAESSGPPEGATPDSSFVPDTSDDRHPVGARRADALKLVASRFLASAAASAGSSADRYQVVVHIDQASLSGEAPQSPLCALENGPGLAVETARRLGCDGSLVGLVETSDGEPLNVGRKTRAIPPALRRALKARDGGCRFPGCHHTRFTEGHHIEHWANGDETRLSNLVTLCHHHHHLLHEGGYRIERTDDGVFRFLGPDSLPVRDDFAIPRRFRGIALADLNRTRGVEVRPDTVVTRWGGETMDYSMAIDALLAARERTRARHALRIPAHDRVGDSCSYA